MAGSREVAEAYIEVHGDLEPFRKSLNDAGAQAQAAGINMADEFGEGWNKRIKSEVSDRWESLINAMYSDNKLDWNRLISKFDTTDLDRASVQIEDFMRDMRIAGKLTEDQYDNLTQKVREAIKAKQNEIFVQNDLNEITRAQTEAIKENIRFDKMRADQARLAAQIDRDHAAAIRMNQQMQDRFLRDHAAALRENENRQMQFLRDHAAAIRINEQMKQKLLRDHAEAIRINNALEMERPGIITKSIAAMTGLQQNVDETGKKTGLLNTITDKLRLSWARMDSTVRFAIGAIIAAAGPIATLGSGIAGSATALLSSLGMALGAAIPLGSAFGAMAIGIGLAVSSMDTLKARFPEVERAAVAIGDTWQMQADRFADGWGQALGNLLTNFNTQLGKYDFGTPMGKAFGVITDAFNEFMMGPGGFDAFMQAMATTLPNAVQGFGVGFAGVFGAVMSTMAGAAPIAEKLGKDFQEWGLNLGIAAEKARASGQMQAVFERMRESLLAVLDLVGSVAKAIGILFMLGSESGNRMLHSLAGIVDQFNAWANTEAGRQAILTWFNNAERIIRSMEPLAVGLGKAMALLVTERSISLFADLMARAGELLPILAEMLSVISDLGILNILTAALVAVGSAIQPLLPALSQIATSLGDVLVGAIDAVTPLLVAVGEALAPIAQAAADLWAQIAPALVPAIEQLVAVLTPLITNILDLAAAIITQLIPFIGPLMVQYITSTVTAFTILMGVINAVVGFITTVATELINFFANLGTNIANFNATVNQMLADFWNTISTNFQNFITGFQIGWDTFWGGLGTGLQAIWTTIVQYFTDAITQITTGFNTWVAEFQTGWNTFWTGIQTGLAVIWATIITYLTQEWNNIVAGFQAVFVAPFQQFWSAFWNGLDPELRAVIQGIVLSIQMGWQDTLNNLNNFISTFVNGWNKFWGDVLATHNRKVQETIDGFNKWAADINNTVNRFVGDVVAKWNKFWGDIISTHNQKVAETIAGFNRWAADINGTVNRFVSDVVNRWNSFWADVNARVSSGWSQISGAFNNGVAVIRGVISGFVASAQAQWNGFWNTVNAAAQTMMGALSSTVNSRLNEVRNWFAQLPGQVGSALAGLANMLFSIGSNAISSLVRAIAGGAGQIVGAITGAVGGAINAAKRMLGIASPSKVFTEFGLQTDRGFVRGIERGEGQVLSAAEHMTEQALAAFDRTKARLAGIETARGLAEGLETSKARVQAALGKLDPKVTSDFSTAVAGTAGRLGTVRAANAVPVQTTQKVVENLNFYTRATDPTVLSGMVVDRLDSLTGKGNL